MKKSILAFIAIAVVLITTTAFMKKDSTGKAGYSNAPGDAGNCTSCHGGGAGPTTVSISTIPALDPGNTYTPGATYTINIQVSNSNFNLFGFDAVVINGTAANSANSGTIVSPGSGVKFLIGNVARKNATHSTPKSGTGSAVFTFVWNAPLSSTATAIYASGNAVNGNGAFSGDAVGTGMLLMTPSSATGLKELTETMSGFDVYPNPASDVINFSYFLKEESQVSIDLIAINGQVAANLLTEKQAYGINKRSVTIPKQVAPGVYFVKATCNNEKVAQRLVVIN